MRLNGIFRDNMVLQRDREIRVFGETGIIKRNKITASIIDPLGKVLTKGVASQIFDDGFFCVIMPALPAGGPYTLTVSASSKREENSPITISNVYIGEVWIAAGQDNMEYPLMRTSDARYDVPRCPETNIHFYKVPVAGVYDEEQRRAEDETKWVTISRNTCGDMSGVDFYFARMIETYLDVHGDIEDLHIGIIGCYVGGTNIASWQSLDSLKRTRVGRRYIKDYNKECALAPVGSYESIQRSYESACASYYGKVRDFLRGNPYMTYDDTVRLLGPAPWPPPVGSRDYRRPGALFDTMVLRLVPFSLRGVIFYQGEEDCNEHSVDYSVVFKTMIEDWREAFWDDNLPFIFCQLPMYISRDRKYMGYDDLKWPRLRKEQTKIAHEVPYTYMAVLIDCGEFDNMHPSDKKTPGRRLAQLALRFVYGFNELPAVCPYVLDVRRGDGVEITFNGDFNALNLNSIFASDDTGFEVAGEDGEFIPASATIDFDGKTVILDCPSVEHPMKVRYAYFSYGMANLVSDSGLAAAPFLVSIDKAIGEFY